MMKETCSIAVATALLGMSSLTLAQTPPWVNTRQLSFYVGAGVGSGTIHRSASDLTGLNNTQLDDQDTTYTVRTGVRLNPFFAVEAGYYDLGKYNFSGTPSNVNVPVNGSARARSAGVSLVGIIPINTFDIYGRIGWARSELKFNANTPLLNQNETQKQSEATYGVGGRWTFVPNWGLFVEWMKNDKIRVDSYMGGIDFRF